MASVVLLSSGRHPESGRPRTSPHELAAAALALAFDADCIGLHAGRSCSSDFEEVKALGLRQLVLVDTAPDVDIVAPLLRQVHRLKGAYVFSGSRAETGESSGLVPYVLAAGLGYGVVSDVIGVASDPQGTLCERKTSRGLEQVVLCPPGAVFTVHDPSGGQSTGSSGRRSQCVLHRVQDGAGELDRAPMRPVPGLSRPPVWLGGPSHSLTAAQRWKARLEVAPQRQRRLLEVDAEEAAREVLACLRRMKVYRSSHDDSKA